MTEVFPDIEALIPHRLGMKLIDKILETDWDESLTAGTTIRESWPMCEDGLMGTTLTIEISAQTVGALHGVRGMREKKGRPAVGLLVGVKSAVFHQAFLPVGAELEVSVKSLYGTGGYGAFECQVRHEGQVVSEASLQVMEPEGDVLDGLMSHSL